MASGIDIGQAYVQIVPSAQGIKGSVKKILDPEAADAGDSAGMSIGRSMIKKIAAIGVGAAIAKTVKDSISEGAKLEQSLGGIETLYKGNANLMKKYAREAYKTAGVSANEYMENVTSFSASLISSLGGNTQKAAKISDLAMRDMSDNANKMGTDMGLIQNAYQGFAKQNYTMLDNLKLGYGGTKTEMERLLVDAEKLAGKKYDISNLSDVYEAIHVIQGKLGITGTTAKEAAETISGSFGMLKASWKDLLGNMALGNDITPQLTNLGKSVVSFAKNLVPAIVRAILAIPKALIQNAPAIMKAVMKWLTTARKTAESKFQPWMAKNAPKMAAQAGKLMIAFANGIIKNSPAIMEALARLLLAVLKGIAQGIVSISRNIDRRAFTAISNIFRRMKSAIVNKISSIVSAARLKFGAIINAIISPINKARNMVASGIGKIKSIINGAKLSLPRFKLPHFKIDGGKPPWGIGGHGVKPSIDVEWRAKGAIFTRPTIFGLNGGRLQGVGEAGAEAALPLSALWRQMDAMNSRLIDAVTANQAAIIGAVITAIESIAFYVDSKELARATANPMNDELNAIQIKAIRRKGRR